MVRNYKIKLNYVRNRTLHHQIWRMKSRKKKMQGRNSVYKTWIIIIESKQVIKARRMAFVPKTGLTLIWNLVCELSLWLLELETGFTSQLRPSCQLSSESCPIHTSPLSSSGLCSRFSDEEFCFQYQRMRISSILIYSCIK